MSVAEGREADRAAHWEGVYAAKADGELSWFQSSPARSLELIGRLGALPVSAIDVGGGQSALAGELLRLGVERVAVLDISESALRRGRERLGAAASRVSWIRRDVLDGAELGSFELWHDRACFHFLTEEGERSKYAALAGRTVAPGGHAIIAGFGAQGPERCSGLGVRRASPQEIAGVFGPMFRLVESAVESHTTPWGKGQEFVYAVLRRL
ncbi:MAG: class I SAM-dependent methyltransferase [Planctomycetota bacterium]|nr:class I SAM-dependent methyltransferase [Planctomycetota bacterium]